MCHMLFTPFIFVRRQCSLVPPTLSFSPPQPLFLFSRSRTRHYICFAHHRSYSLAPSSSFPFYPNLLPLTPPSFPHRAHVRALPFSLLFLSTGLLAAISPRCYSFLAPSLFLSSLPYPITVSLLLATSLILFSVLLAALSSLCLPFRLLVYTLVTPARPSLSLSCVRDSPLLLSRTCCFSFSMFTTAEEPSVYSLSLSLFLSLALPTRSSCVHLSTHVERYFPPSPPFGRPSLSFTRAEGLFPRRRAG